MSASTARDEFDELPPESEDIAAIREIASLTGFQVSESADPDIIAIMTSPRETPADVDALASEICRQLGECDAEIARSRESENAEHARIMMRYHHARHGAEQKRELLESLGKQLAETADFGKKKSRTIGFGSYGRRTKPEKVSVVEEAAAIAWLRVVEPGAIRTKEAVDAKAAKAIVLGHLKATGEIPAGFAHEEEREEPWIKSEV